MSDVTSFEWTIVNLKQACDLNGKTNSPIFNLNNYPSAKFALFLKGHVYNTHGTSPYGTTTGWRKKTSANFVSKKQNLEEKTFHLHFFTWLGLIFIVFIEWKGQ
jgi:hypothetical protein